MNIIIPLGGKGERFKQEGYNEPKPFIKVLDKEILFHVIDNLFLNKDSDSESDPYSELKSDINIYIIYNKDLDDHNFCIRIKERYPKINLIKLDYDTRGAAETIYIGISEIIKESSIKKTLLIDGDTFYTKNIINMFYNNLKTNDGTIFYTYNDNPNPIFSYISFDENNIVNEIIEKTKISNNANTGAYGFLDINQLQKYAKYVLDNNITFKNECYTSCIIDIMIKDGKKFNGIELEDKDVHILGTPLQVRNFEKNKFNKINNL